MTLRRRAVYLLLGLVAVCAALFFARNWWGPPVGRFLDVGGPPQRADYALVLSGDPQTRPTAAAYLYRHGYVARILLTQPQRNADDAAAIEDATERSRRVLERLGVKPDDIQVLEGDVRTTIDEAHVAAPLVRSQPQARFVVVTSNYHTRRGLWSLRHAVPEAAARMAAFSAPVDGVRPDNWWHSQVGIGTYCGEYLRLGFYYFRYGEGPIVVAFVLIGVGSLWMLVRVWRRRNSP